LIIHYHVIKTGGSTIGEKLKSEYYGFYQRADGVIMDGAEFVQSHNLRRSEVIKTVPNAKEMIIIREPAEWLVSQYHQDIRRRKVDTDFKVWYYTDFPNSVNPIDTRFNRLTKYVKRFFSNIYDVLENMWMVFITEYLDVDLPLLFTYLGLNPIWENQRMTGKYDKIDKAMTPRVYKLTEDMRERIKKENPEDYKLYEYAKELRKKKRWTLKSA
jgi:hypothetical protein